MKFVYTRTLFLEFNSQRLKYKSVRVFTTIFFIFQTPYWEGPPALADAPELGTSFDGQQCSAIVVQVGFCRHQRENESHPTSKYLKAR